MNTPRLIVPIFFTSGALALGYQVLWSKMLLGFIGVSAWSYSIVLASFMAGLAIGSVVFGRLSDRISNSLKLFAYLELGVGLYAIAYPGLSEVVSSVYSGWVHFTPETASASQLTGIWFKVIASVILLLPPTILMGGTYPALVRYCTSVRESLGHNVSRLYAINALGAVAGSLGMAFGVLPWLGLTGSLMLLALCNGLVAVMALALSARGSADAYSPVARTGTGAEEPRSAALRKGHVLILIAGVMSFSYEIGWTRFFGLVLGSSTYSFAVMLAAFISGISIGSYLLVKYRDRVISPGAWFGWSQLLAGALVLLPIPLYDYIPWVFAKFGSTLSFSGEAYFMYEAGKIIICYLVMLPPTILIGMAVPLMIQYSSSGLDTCGKTTGLIYAWNTWGNVLGALLAGMLLLSLLGMEQLLRWTAIVHVAVGVTAVWMLRSGVGRQSRATLWSVAGGTALGAVIIVMLYGSWDRNMFRMLPFRRKLIAESFDELKEKLEGDEVPMFADDPAGHFMIVIRPDGTTGLYVNGKPDASSGGDMPTQLLSSHVPLILHPSPRDVCVVGFGSGVSAGAALAHPVDRVDAVDILPSIREAAGYFKPWNGDPFSDDRFRLIVDDARNYLAYTTQKYDVIVAEPSNPWVAGVGSMFAREYYLLSRDTLRKNGMYMQWLQGYELGDDLLVSVLRTFRDVFPFVYIFQGSAADFLLVGALSPVKDDWAGMQARMDVPEVKKQLSDISIRSLSDFLFLQRFSPLTVDYLAARARRVNTDDNLLLEYNAPFDLFQKKSPSLPVSLDERFFAPPSLLWRRYIATGGDVDRGTELMAMLLDKRLYLDGLAESFRDAYMRLHPGGMSSIPGTLVRKAPEGFWDRPDETRERLMGRIGYLLETGLYRDAARLVQSASRSVLIESALSSRAGEAWLGAVKAWRGKQKVAAVENVLRLLEVDLLLAAGQVQAAARVIKARVSDLEKMPMDYAVLRAGFGGDVELRGLLLKKYRERNRPVWVDRLGDIDEGRPFQ